MLQVGIRTQQRLLLAGLRHDAWLRLAGGAGAAFAATPIAAFTAFSAFTTLATLAITFTTALRAALPLAITATLRFACKPFGLGQVFLGIGHFALAFTTFRPAFGGWLAFAFGAASARRTFAAFTAFTALAALGAATTTTAGTAFAA